MFHVTGPTTSNPGETTTLASTSKPTATTASTTSAESTTSTVDCSGFFPGYICSDRFISIWSIWKANILGKTKVNLLILNKAKKTSPWFSKVPKSKFEANQSH